MIENRQQIGKQDNIVKKLQNGQIEIFVPNESSNGTARNSNKSQQNVNI